MDDRNKPLNPRAWEREDPRANWRGRPVTAMSYTILGLVVGIGATLALTSFLWALMVAAPFKDGPTGPLDGFLFFFGSPLFTGPLCATGLWVMTRKSNQPFAVGAAVSGGLGFLLMFVALLILVIS